MVLAVPLANVIRRVGVKPRATLGQGMAFTDNKTTHLLIKGECICF